MTRRRPTQQEMSRARRSRDASYDGVFWVCVKTTGVFCRPSCPARSPLERNVCYALSVSEALTTGFRPCKRCRPVEANGTPDPWLRRLLDLADRRRDVRITDADLRAAGIDPVRARRHFRKRFGMTFHAYHRAIRLGAALGELKRGAATSGVGYGHGFESDSGFRDAFARRFRTTPGRSDTVSHIVVRAIESPVGTLQLGASPRGLCLLEFADRRALPTELAYLEARLGRPVVPGDSDFIAQMTAEIAAYFAGELRTFRTPLDILGTPFQQRVWQELQRIPYGRTISYGQLAERVSRPGAQRAVGQANGANRIAIAIPCHRVVQSDGQLRGYGGGLWRKQFLLDLEKGVRLTYRRAPCPRLREHAIPEPRRSQRGPRAILTPA